MAVAGLFSIQHFPCFVFVFVFFISCLLHFIKNNTSVVQFQLMQGVSTSLYCYICKDINKMKNSEGHSIQCSKLIIPCFLEFNDCFTNAPFNKMISYCIVIETVIVDNKD